MNDEELSALVVDSAYHVHRGLGPGLLESVYEIVLAKVIAGKGVKVLRQSIVPLEWEGLRLEEAFRVGLLVGGRIIVELKSVEEVNRSHYKQLLTYLRLMRLPIGLLINFGAPSFRQGIRRVVNDHSDFASSRLRVNR